VRIRVMTDEDVETVVRVWHAAGRQVYTFIDRWQRFMLDQARGVFRDHIASSCEVWVAEQYPGGGCAPRSRLTAWRR
jgi:hypothetical protein